MSDFRVNARNLFLTYPQCPLSPSEVQALLSSKPWWPEVARWWISSEKHLEEGSHIHGLLSFVKKKDIRSSEFFDIVVDTPQSETDSSSVTYHCNIQSAKNFNAVKIYVCKDGNFVHNERFDMSNPNRFVARKRDWEAWSREIGEHRPQVEEGHELRYTLKRDMIQTHGFVSLSFDPALKKRNLWVVGVPDCGKTYWLSHALAAFDVYWVPAGSKYPYEGYQDQNLIVYDDHFPSFAAIADVCNTHLHRKHVFGDVRFYEKYWKIGHTRTMIVLSNNPPDYGTVQCAFEARFVVITLEDGDSIRFTE